MAACEAPGMRLRWNGGACVCVCENLGQQCLCLTCKQEQKVIPACTHLACRGGGGADSRFNEHFKDQLLPRLFSSLCTKSCTYTAQRSSLLMESTFSGATQRSRGNLYRCGTVAVPRGHLFRKTLKWIHLKPMLNITQPQATVQSTY